MLGCHDGIPLLDLRGLLPEADIQRVIDAVVANGGYVKDLHGAKNVYYQVNAAYYSALGGEDARMLTARAIQLFMPGRPQVWYLDLFAGENDYDAVHRAGVNGHKEINRTNLTTEEVSARLDRRVVREQLELLRFRNTFPAFTETTNVHFGTSGSCLTITWENDSASARLEANLDTAQYRIVSESC